MNPSVSTKGPLELLFIEDSPTDAELLAHALKRAGLAANCERVDRAPALENALDRRTWDLVISDHSMPGFSAVSALEIIQRRNLDLPLIIVSGTIEPQAAVAAMRAGARDFVMKDDLTRLIPAVERELRESENRRARRKAEREKEQFVVQSLQAEKMDALGRLAGGIAHDFNNLLTAISGYCHLLLDALPPEDSKREDVLEIMKAGKRAATLTRHLLALSRRQVVQPRVLDVNRLVSDVTRMLQRLLGEDIRFETKLDPDLGRIRADPSQLEQVLISLAVNARDTMPKGGLFVLDTANYELAAARQRGVAPDLPDGSYVVLSARDSGTAMDEQTQARIFEPFFTTKERGKGAGLALATLYGIVKQSGGDATVESEPEKGTTFRLFFPRVGEALTPDSPEPRVELRRGNETVLLVEDDEAVRRFVHRVLAKNGYNVLPAITPDEALRISREHPHPVHLLLSDVVMPMMRGDELAERIAKTRPELRVLLMSGYASTGGPKPLPISAGFIEKPISPGNLLTKIREVLDASR